MIQPEINKLSSQFESDHITKTLSPFISEHRKSRIESVVMHRLETISLAIESPSDLNNALAATRTGEALGIATIHIISPGRNAHWMRHVTRGAFYWVEILFHATFQAFFHVIQSEKKLLAGAVIDANKNLSDVPVTQSICVLVGNETHGLSEQAKNACDIQFSIPLCGMTNSLNLSVAAAISLFDISQRKRALLKNKTDLSKEKINKLRAQFYLQSANPKLVNGLFKTQEIL